MGSGKSLATTYNMYIMIDMGRKKKSKDDKIVMLGATVPGILLQVCRSMADEVGCDLHTMVRSIIAFAAMSMTPEERSDLVAWYRQEMS